MKNLMAPKIPLALVLLAAVAAVALRAVARRPEAPGTAPAPVTVIAGQSQPRPTVTTSRHDGTGGEMARPPAHPGRPANAVDQAQHIFHELHADGRHPSCAVCDSQHGAAWYQPSTRPLQTGPSPAAPHNTPLCASTMSQITNCVADQLGG
jgi:hypothetical protein